MSEFAFIIQMNTLFIRCLIFFSRTNTLMKTMSISYLTICKIAICVYSLTKESPLKKNARKEFEVALYVLQTVQQESNYREGLNRALTHLESAYFLYISQISTWDIWDAHTVLWNKYTYANNICIYISIIHYVLGNVEIAKKWLLENLTVEGAIYFDRKLLKEIGFEDDTQYVIQVCGTDFEKYNAIKQKSLYNDESYHSSLYDDNDDYDPIPRI